MREGDEVVYVERVTTPRIMRVEQVIGGRAPLHVTAAGKLFWLTTVSRPVAITSSAPGCRPVPLLHRRSGPAVPIGA